jgi:hypothetical protein
MAKYSSETIERTVERIEVDIADFSDAEIVAECRRRGFVVDPISSYPPSTAAGVKSMQELRALLARMRPDPPAPPPPRRLRPLEFWM